jgi:hypothetical protein
MNTGTRRVAFVCRFLDTASFSYADTGSHRWRPGGSPTGMGQVRLGASWWNIRDPKSLTAMRVTPVLSGHALPVTITRMAVGGESPI